MSVRDLIAGGGATTPRRRFHLRLAVLIPPPPPKDPDEPQRDHFADCSCHLFPPCHGCIDYSAALHEYEKASEP